MSVKNLYIRNGESATIKPLGFNGTIPKVRVHILPKVEGLNSSMIECTDDCYICKVIEWLDSNRLFDNVKEKFKALGTHFNIRPQNIYTLPVYHFNSFNKSWEFKVLKLFSNQFVSFVDFLEVNNLYDIGNPANQLTINIRPDRWNYIYMKSNIPFIMTDVSKLQSDYNKFISLLSNPENFNIKSEPTYIKAVNYQFGMLIQSVVKSLSES